MMKSSVSFMVGGFSAALMRLVAFGVRRRKVRMQNEFTAVIEKDGEWYVAYCPEIPGANGQGRTTDEARENLADAIALILQDRREDGLRGAPPEALRETVIVK